MNHRGIVALLMAAVTVDASIAAPADIYVSIDHLVVPPGYDNVGGRSFYGQLFLALDEKFIGVRFYLGEPSGPPSHNSLTGPADLVLVDAADLSEPNEIARFEVVPAGSELHGAYDFYLPAAVPTTVGHRYFVGLQAVDLYGIGMRSQTTSTYPDGSEANFFNGQIIPFPNGRDLSFRIFSREPGIASEPFLLNPICRAANYSADSCQETAPPISSLPVSAVLDHSGNYYAPDGAVRAYRTDLGCTSPPCIGFQNFGANTPPSGYRQDCAGTAINFHGELEYVGAASGDVGSCAGGATTPSSYLDYDGHSGYDFDASWGDVIVAAAPGILDRPNFVDPILGGNTTDFNPLRIRHVNGSETWYLHSLPGSECTVADLCAPGETRYVRAREPIAKTGNTGLSCGTCTEQSCPCNHLHFEVRPADDPIEAIDPFGCAPDVTAVDPQRCSNARLWLDGAVFLDGFETGNTVAWSSAIP